MADPKGVIRVQVRAKRAETSREELNGRSGMICDRILALGAFDEARGVALFWPMLERGEVDIRALDTAAREADKRVYYPYLRRQGEVVIRGFRHVDTVDQLQAQEWPFAEPDAKAPEALPGDLDLIVVPALAASPNGQRLGYGSGFYDAVLPDLCPPAKSIAVVYEFEVIDDLPSVETDFPCDLVVTDEQLVVPGQVVL